MTYAIGRRTMIGAAGAAVLASAFARNAGAQETPKKRKIIAVCCSLRKGKTTSAALTHCLNAAKEQDADLDTELIELAELNIPAQVALGLPLKPGELDDFPGVAEKLLDPAVAGLVVGSPVYFGTMSALCKAFLDRCMA
ncbi:MAG: NAD(P)H-dependent oxidoreductase, partial [Candidatus Hydrogenedentes bacterium]|nr:NAD(P)H-dependent oxidoreductase [Candidatus Hydrogenedentota bacterium]